MTIAGVLFLAVLDSINPSAIVVTLYLLSTAGSRALVHVVVYIGAIFITYLLLGVMMVLGIESLLPSLGGALSGRTGLIVQSLVGLVLLVYSLTASTNRQSSAAVARPSASTYAALVMLGVSVTAMELPTAIPYFAAIALISEAELPIRAWAPLLGVYNVIFVIPPDCPPGRASCLAGPAGGAICCPQATAGKRCAGNPALGCRSRWRSALRDGHD